jgi:Domain of unknown function (DUF4042)
VSSDALQSTLARLLELQPKTQAPPAERAAADMLNVAHLVDACRTAHANTGAGAEGATPRQQPWVEYAVAHARLARRLQRAGCWPPDARAASELVQHLVKWHRSGAPLRAAAMRAECMRACGTLASEHYPRMSDTAKAALLAELLCAVPSPGSAFDPVATSTSALDTLEALLSKHADGVSGPWLEQCLSAVASCLHRHANSSAGPVVDEWHAALYGALLRAAAHAVAAVDAASVAQHAATLVDTASRFWAYGRAGSSAAATTPAAASSTSSLAAAKPAAAASPAPPAGARPGKYVPPSRRTSAARTTSDSFSAAASDSDTSTGSGGGAAAAVAVRLAALRVVSAALKQDAPALHPLWDRLLPHADPLSASTRPATLLGVLLHDPSPQARLAAAQALQLMLAHRKTRAFMAVAAEEPLKPPRARAFTSLSASLAAMLGSAHAALAAALHQETVPEAQLELVKAARGLVAHTPYARLPASLLGSVLKNALQVWAPDGARSGEVCLQSCGDVGCIGLRLIAHLAGQSRHRLNLSPALLPCSLNLRLGASTATLWGAQCCSSSRLPALLPRRRNSHSHGRISRLHALRPIQSGAALVTLTVRRSSHCSRRCLKQSRRRRC